MSDLKIFDSISNFISFRKTHLISKKIGLVPTMGALHTGHASLVQTSARQNEITILSIYVNPTQFNNPEDLKKYPRTWEADLKLAQQSGAQIVIAPQYEEIYADQYRYKITESEFSKILCGQFRPGHFDGVLTIVMKLLQIVQADNAYFGEKDFQQLQLIKDMAAAFFIKSDIIGCPTFREDDGLAMSSRNLRLTAEGRKKSPLIFKAITEADSIETARKVLEKEKIEVEYLEEHYGRRFIAAYIDQVRLIDNVKI
jgi:pantoate--beta-alanine ligase